ncbi:hypothetical protein [Acidocella sp.]|uniref:hypothetical protein n=1 Tax=Acidocella sp. TaxID=50710 RepID=UPI003D061A74
MCDDDNLLQVKIDIIEKLDKMIDGLADKSDGFVSPQIAIFLGFVSIVLSVFNLKNQSLSAVNLAVFVMSLTVFLAVFAIMTLFIRYTKIIRTKINVINNTRDQIVELKTKQEIYTHYATFLTLR